MIRWVVIIIVAGAVLFAIRSYTQQERNSAAIERIRDAQQNPAARPDLSTRPAPTGVRQRP